MRRALVKFVLAALVMAAPLTAHAVNPDEILSDPALETRARDISAGLRCLVCQNQSIDDSDAPLAGDLRVLVRERLLEGDTDRQIIDFVVARYGDFVLLKPRFTINTLVLWLAPPLLLGLGGITVFRLYHCRRRVAVAALSDDEETRLAQILARDSDKTT